MIGLLAWQHRADEQRLAGLAQGVTRDRVALELQARASAIARHAAESAGVGIADPDTEALGRRLQSFSDDPTLSALTVRNAAGDVLYQWRRDGVTSADSLQIQGLAPIRTMVESIPGAATPQTLGEVRVVLTQAASAGVMIPGWTN